MIYTVAVRALCDFTAKRGDLDLRFTPAPSAQEGIAGHALVASRRGSDYESEVSLEGSYKNLRVRGRADGYDPLRNQLEEVKTFRGDLQRMADNRRALHWAQVKIYGWLLCRDKGLDEINLALVYFDISSLEETLLTERFTAVALQGYFESQCEQFLIWANQELLHRRARDEALAALAFPHAGFRAGQHDLATAVYKASLAGQCLMAQAPTGIGKTIGTIFPLLKATPARQLDKLYFLAAKTPGRALALHALTRIRESAPTLPLRVLELVAKTKACEHPDKACHGDACPLARGFYDRLPGARSAAVSAAAGVLLDKAALREVALAHQVCPYYLSQDLLMWSDVVVGDYNYYFDSSALLYSQSVANAWRVSVLVDEAHNLLERARKMYSATLSQAELQRVHDNAPGAVKRQLERLNQSIDNLARSQREAGDAYQVYAQLSAPLLKTLQQTVVAITDFLAANPTRMDGALQDFYFSALHFSRMVEAFGEHSLFDVTLQAAGSPVDLSTSMRGAGAGSVMLCIRNVVPAPFLTPRFVAANSVVLFSATLSPRTFYTDTLGLPTTLRWVDVQSPFVAKQLRVEIVSDVSTRWQHRDESLLPIADLIARQYTELPGNYLAFSSSYDYLQKLLAVFAARHPHITVWAQTPGMEEAARDAFLERFRQEGRGIGFAVLGGSFAEGIDLPGSRLIGAFIATLGLPQVNSVNEQIKARMALNFGPARAYDYAYLYPGIQKVVQAAGRVIRTTSDQGVIHLIDDRFTRPDIRALFPAWWQVHQIRVNGRQAATTSPTQNAVAAVLAP